MSDNVVKGYKVFNPDWTCFGKKQYACPGKFEEDVELSICDSGMHFCKVAADCFNYYKFDPDNRVAEVISYGNVAEEGDKCCTDKLEIVREIPWAELLTIVNTGKGCTGINNSGSFNSGDGNSGSYNSGDGNSGDGNSGSYNSGSYNSGSYNSGSFNSGSFNSGDGNSGSYNSGSYNSGSYNSGDYNKVDYSNGCFNTVEPKIHIFNKPSEWTYRDWLYSDARALMTLIPRDILEYRCWSVMTDKEKKANPDAETTGGYLKELDNSECGVIWWSGLNDREKSIIMSIPNFDKEIFKEITGVDVTEDDQK